MKRIVRIMARASVLWVSLAVAADVRAVAGLPDLASDSVVDSVERADQEIAQRKYSLALARLEGVLFPKGVSLGFVSTGPSSRRDLEFSAIRKAVGMWERALGGDSPIQWNANNPSAEVNIQFVSAIPKRGADTLGLIDLERQYKWNATKHFTLTSGTISVVTSHNSDPLTTEESQHVVMHELGHLLGLTDVVESEYLMGPLERGRPLSSPTDAEIQAVIQIRKTVRQRIESVRKKLQTEKGIAYDGTLESIVLSAELSRTQDAYECAVRPRTIFGDQ